MLIDRETLLEGLGGGGAVAAMSDEARADALERFLVSRLNGPRYLQEVTASRSSGSPTTRRGAGLLFGDGRREPPALAPLPEKPTLLDFFFLRTPFPVMRHLLQSATDALEKGESEEQVLACLLHDFALGLVKVDHGWWCAQMVEPYVSEKVAWAIRYHQALRFFPDESVGYAYPALYVEMFGKDYVPEPYITETYEIARRHRWYLEARMVTVHDLYGFDPDRRVSFDPFHDIIGRHFRQPKEGLGFDGSPVAHMWRSVIFPDHPL